MQKIIGTRRPRTRWPWITACALAAGGCSPGAPSGPGVAAHACTHDGELVGEIYGEIAASLDWRGERLACDGMPRPRGAGARLHFSGPVRDADTQRQLALIISLPDLRRGQVAEELPAALTLIEENAGRFFSTPERNACWADIDTQEPLGNAAGKHAEYRISGLLYCVVPLAALGGSSSIAIRDLRFTGRLDWAADR